MKTTKNATFKTWGAATRTFLESRLPDVWNNYRGTLSSTWDDYDMFSSDFITNVEVMRKQFFQDKGVWNTSVENTFHMKLEWLLNRGMADYAEQEMSLWKMQEMWEIVLQENEADRSLVTAHQWETWTYSRKIIQDQFDAIDKLTRDITAVSRRGEMIDALTRILKSGRQVPAEKLSRAKTQTKPDPEPAPGTDVDAIDALRTALSTSFVP